MTKPRTEQKFQCRNKDCGYVFVFFESPGPLTLDRQCPKCKTHNILVIGTEVAALGKPLLTK